MNCLEHSIKNNISPLSNDFQQFSHKLPVYEIPPYFSLHLTEAMCLVLGQTVNEEDIKTMKYKELNSVTKQNKLSLF